MKKLVYIAIFLQLSISSLLLADPVVFNDPNLQLAVEAELGIDNPNEIDMLGLTYLSAPSAPLFEISDLTGLESATELIYLNLNGNPITDISALEYTTNVNELHLSGNLLSDPDVLLPMYGLTSLVKLYLNNSQITDLTGLEYATDVNELHLSDNAISDISPISTLTSLVNLVLNNNQITDISALPSLENLDTLFLSANQIDDLSPLSDPNLASLTGLYLGDNLISGDILDLSGLSNLTMLDLADNDIDDISAVSNLTSLELLSLTDNLVVDVSCLSNLTNLRYLYLANNKIRDLSGLIGEEPNDLESLSLSGNLLDKDSYCTYLSMIADNNPSLTLSGIDKDDYPLDDEDNPTTCIANDLCADAIEVFKDVATVDANNIGATGPEEESLCGVKDWQDVWHFYTPISDEVVNIDLCGSALDTSLVVFDACPGTGGTLLACNDDYNGNGYYGYCGIGSLVTVELTGGETYWIRVAGYSTPTNGTGYYTLIIENAPAPPANNICDDAIEIVQYGVPVTGSTVLAYGTDITSCTVHDTRDVWYYFDPPISGLYLIDPDPYESGDYESTLAVFDGCGGEPNELACNTLYCNWDDNYDECGSDLWKSRIVVSLVGGERYYIRVSGYAGRGGDYNLKVSLAADIDQNEEVNIADLIWLLQEWMMIDDEGDVIYLTSYADIAFDPEDEEVDQDEDGGGDKFVNVLDFAELSRQWLVSF